MVCFDIMEIDGVIGDMRMLLIYDIDGSFEFEVFFCFIIFKDSKGRCWMI